MSISRDTFDPAKNYKRVRYHQDPQGSPHIELMGA